MTLRNLDTAALTLGFLSIGAQAEPIEVLRAAAGAGFGAAGLRISGRAPGDAWPSVPTPGALDRVRETAQELRVRISSISGYYISDKTRIEHLLCNVEAARRVGAPLIAQGCFEPDPRRAASLLRDYAQAAQDAGIRIAIEFMPMSSLRSITDVQRIVSASGSGNVGLLIDALHLARSGAGGDDVRQLDPASIYVVQLCDAAAALPQGTSLFDEAMSGRMYPGDGGLELAALLEALPAEVEIELETPVTADSGLPAAEKARKAAAKASAFFSRLAPPALAGRGSA